MSYIHILSKIFFMIKWIFFMIKWTYGFFYFDVAIYSNYNHLDKFCFKVYCVKNLKESLLVFHINLWKYRKITYLQVQAKRQTFKNSFLTNFNRLQDPELKPCAINCSFMVIYERKYERGMRIVVKFHF